jgi:hypothetical protein
MGWLMSYGRLQTGPAELSAGLSATRWLKGSLGFREDREVIMNLVTQLSMRV